MSRRRTQVHEQASERLSSRLNLPACPKGVREVVLNPRATLRYRRAGRYVEGSLYRLRRPGEKGDSILRFANRRETLAELVHALLLDADLQLHRETIVWYLESTDRPATSSAGVGSSPARPPSRPARAAGRATG